MVGGGHIQVREALLTGYTYSRIWKGKWQPTPVFLPGESHGQRSLAGHSPQGSQRVGHDWAQHSIPELGHGDLVNDRRLPE